ncbi:MAG: phosphoribosylaminoimidazolesuccinocarboxamide synthase [Gammaproteobacteria bacterium]
MSTLFESHLDSLELLSRGKVRDIYAIDDQRLLIVTSDRISAFDVILPDPVPGKGEVLTQISNFWFERTGHIISNHVMSDSLESVLPDQDNLDQLRDRTIVARRLKPLPIEAVVRGYIIGSGWKDYQQSGAVCGIDLPEGLELADRLPEPIFTPATKAEVGEHDENISFDQAADLIGRDLANFVRDTSIALYQHAADYARGRGIIIADTKFEFGLDDDGQVVLIDEALTPDSSRFWPAHSYRPGISPPSFDKQFMRDYLETLDWDKKAPGPVIPPEIMERTADKYKEALRLLAGSPDS